MKKIKTKDNYSNFSPEHKEYIKKNKIDKTTTIVYQVALLVVLLFVWELLTRLKVIDAFFVSSPSRICDALVKQFKDGNMMYHIWVTLYETIIGFVAATALGTLVAIILWWSRKVRNVLEPYIVILNALPKIALGPVIIIWVGAGTQAIITMCILICVVITTLSMLNSFLACDKDKLSLMQSMGANKLQILFKLVLPHSLYDFVSVLKINVGMAWVGTIMGEYLVSKAGLGYLIVYAGQTFKLDLVMASTVLLCILASVMYILVGVLEKYVRKYKAD